MGCMRIPLNSTSHYDAITNKPYHFIFKMLVKLNRMTKILVYWFANLFILYAYIEFSHLWVDVGGGSSKLFDLEIPLIILTVTSLYFTKIKNKLYKYVLPILPIIAIYIGIDIFYNYLARMPRASDLQNLSIVWDFSPLLGWMFVLWCVLILLPPALLICEARRHYPNKILFKSIFYRVIGVVALIWGLSTSVFYQFQQKIFKDVVWSQEVTIRKNGRINGFIFYDHQTNANKETLLKYSYSDIDVIRTLYPSKLVDSPNIHLIVLESFIDPRMLQGIDFDKSPLALELKKYLQNNKFSTVISPTYGGGTAQAEFELLTGIPAYGKVNSIEFNVMLGGEIRGFLSHLINNGYYTTATIASDDKYFNAKSAYKSLGLQTVDFLGESHPGVMFDGDLFDVNLDKIKLIIQNSNAPIFNYVLGMYGHVPYKRDSIHRPDIINTSYSDERIKNISNQFYYRTAALSQYIEELIKIDPNSIIYITSDHLPPILNKDIKYQHSNKTNISLLLKDGHYLPVSGKLYYEIPWLFWDILSKTSHNRHQTTSVSSNMTQLYFKTLADSIFEKR